MVAAATAAAKRILILSDWFVGLVVGGRWLVVEELMEY
jgi:hypothetical protein